MKHILSKATFIPPLSHTDGVLYLPAKFISCNDSSRSTKMLKPKIRDINFHGWHTSQREGKQYEPLCIFGDTEICL